MGFALLPRFTVHEVERLSIGSAGVPALLVGPEAPGTHPAAIIQHGYRAAKEDLLPLAVYLAAYGFVSIAGSPLPDLMGTRLFDSQLPHEAAARWARAHDAATHLAHLAPRPLLLSHGRGDDMVPVAGALRLYAAAQPHYAAHPERLALLLYDHRHDVTPEQVADVVNWIAPLFLSDEDEAAGDAAMRAG